MTDEELIKQWKTSKSYSSYNTLKQRHRAMVFRAVNTYGAANIPRASLEAQAWTLFDDAVNNFKGDKGAKFSTYLSYQLRKMDRHTKKYQNIARIPEALAAKIGDYDRAQADLSIKLQRQPTHNEMANALNMDEKHVKQLFKSRRSDLYVGKFEGTTEDPNQKMHDDWLLKELREELQGQERLVYDHLMGYNGKRKVTNKKVLAQKLGMSAGRISQITGSISRKIGPHLKERL